MDVVLRGGHGRRVAGLCQHVLRGLHDEVVLFVLDAVKGPHPQLAFNDHVRAGHVAVGMWGDHIVWAEVEVGQAIAQPQRPAEPYSARWHTASTLLPSGSMTKAP